MVTTLWEGRSAISNPSTANWFLLVETAGMREQLKPFSRAAEVKETDQQLNLPVEIAPYPEAPTTPEVILEMPIHREAIRITVREILLQVKFVTHDPIPIHHLRRHLLIKLQGTTTPISPGVMM
jgi:hypothetical protein